MIDLEWIFSVSILLTANSQKLIYSIRRINSHSRLLSCVLPYTKQNGLKASFLVHKRLRLLRASRRYSIVNVQSSIILQQVKTHCKYFFNGFAKDFYKYFLFLLYNEEKIIDGWIHLHIYFIAGITKILPIVNLFGNVIIYTPRVIL